MKKTQKLLLIPLTLLIVAVSFLIYTNMTKASKNTPESTEIANYASTEEWQKGIEKCIPNVPNPNTQIYSEYGVEDCLEKIMIAAYETNQVEKMSYALQEVVDKDVNFYMLCHSVAHTAGLQSLEFNNNVTELLDQAAKNTVCDWGMGHGILDALAETKPSIEEFKQVSNWCNEQINDLRLYSLCVDGLGHVAWGGTSSFQEAVQWCEQIEDESGRSMCGGGIVMQKYAPASGIGGETPSDLHQDMVNLCKDWEQYVSEPGALDGCFAGAAYIYGLDIVKELNTIWLQPDYNAGNIPSKTENQIYTIIETNLQNCSEYTNDKNSVCQKSLANQIPTRLTQENRNIHENICKKFTDKGASENCTRGLTLTLQ